MVAGGSGEVSYPAGVVPNTVLPDSAAGIPQQRSCFVIHGHRVGTLSVLVLSKVYSPKRNKPRRGRGVKKSEWTPWDERVKANIWL